MTTNRVVVRIDANGAVDTSTRLNNAFSGGNIRGVCTKDGTSFYAVGSNTGAVYTTFGAMMGTTVYNSVTNLRTCSVAGDQLYISSGSSAANGIGMVSPSLPTMSGATLSVIAAATEAPQGFALVDADANVAGVDTMYVAVPSPVPAAGANTLNVEKWTFDGTTWTKQTFAPSLTGSAGAYNVTAWVDGPTTHVVAVTSDNRLVGFEDTSATPTVTVLAPAVALTGLRGVSRSPDVTP
jgi:hypothetical protein